ncbi:MAG TPA: flagellar biosynthesis protein FlhF [Phycisphaerales bacterium]|nr:flagellar biosynthesis protein FlhF [Phycisphaerales bacterium]
MKLRTFRARTMAEALAAVKKDLGRGAVILHTRSLKVGGVLGMGRRTVVEIIASDEVNVAGPRHREPAPARTRSAARPPAGPTAAATVPARPARHGVAAYAYAASATDDAPEAPQRPAPSPARHPAPSGARAVWSTPEPVRAGSPAYAGAAVAHAVVTAPEPAGPRGAVAENAPSVLPVRRRGLAEPVGVASSLEADLALVKQMVGQVLQSTGPAPGMMPAALFKHYLKMLECQVARELADSIVSAVRDELSAGELADEPVVRRAVLRRLAAHIPVAKAVAAPARAADGRPLTIALVGPTGVGKTTTIAKLAASYKLRHGRRVGLITTDTYRIAAVEQLRTYANIISLPLRVVMAPGEMSGACAALADMDVVLIDTAGRSPNDALRLTELGEFIAAADPHETHLVLSSASSEAVLARAAAQFGPVRPNRLILTKLDEAVNFGVLVNAARRVGTTLSFVTTGQEVPDHIEAGEPERLARLVLDGALA